MIPKFFQLGALGSLLLMLNQCISTDIDSPEIRVELSSKTANPSYLDIISESTRSANVYENFETIYALRATYLDSKTIETINKKGQYLESPPSRKLIDTSKSTHIFVSLYIPSRNEDKSLTKKDVWHIYSQQSEQKFLPKSIRKLKNKEYWKNFFPYVHQWSEEYLIIFDQESLSPDSQNLFEITFSHKEAKTKFKWKKS